MSRKRTHAMGLICALTLVSSCNSGADSAESETSNVALRNGAVCGIAIEGGTMVMACPSGKTISNIRFASYGTPSGFCGAFALGACNAPSSVPVVSSACIGKSTCSVSANKSTFGDPCVGTAKRLYAQATCASVIDSGTPGTGGVSGSGGSVATGTGLLAEYYDGTTFDTLALTRTDPTVNFDWGPGAPASSMDVDLFSARWTGQVQALYSETYTFSTQSDDGVRLWVNGKQLIEAWADYSPTQNSGTIALLAGQKYDLKIEFRENTGGAIIKLSWSSSSQANQIVPQSQLYPAAGGSVGTGGTPGTGGTLGMGGALGTGGNSSKAGGPGTGGGTPGNCTSSSTLQLIGNQIRDTSGISIVARGPELVTAALEQTAAIDSAANQGANAIRLLLTLDAVNGMTPATFDTLVGRAVSHNMIVWLSLFTWDTDNNWVIGSALGGGNFYSLASPIEGTCSKATPAPCFLAVWSRQWLKDLVTKYKGHVIIDAGQEYIGVANPDTDAGRTEWANAAQSNVRWFRGAGYVVPLEIMANYQGRDLFGIIQKGASIRAVDTVVVDGFPQTMFGWQAYWASDWYKGWQGGLLLGGSNTITGAQAIHQFAVTQPFPIQVGIDNYAGDTGVEYKAEIDQCAADHASWLWWSWTGSNTAECPNDGATCQAYVTGSQSGFPGAVRSACGL